MIDKRPPLENDDGDPPCWAHLAESGSEHVGREDLAELVENLADAVIICDPAGTIVFWNAAATRVFGWTPSEALGENLDLIIPERLRARHWAGYRRVIETGTTDYGGRLLEVPALHKDGHGISIAFTVSLLRVAGRDRVKGIAAVIRDDTARWEERRQLRRDLAALDHKEAPQ